MSEHRPQFSIVMPTRNRAHLLRLALQTALAQTFDDFEILISNNASSDATAEVAQSTGDSRVRYVQTDQVLPMPAHWEFALGRARGKYVTYLCDDDAIVPGLLARLDAFYGQGSPAIIYWSSSGYYHQSWYEEKHRNQLRLRQSTPRAQVEPSAAILNDLFALNYGERHFPRMLNTCCPRELLLDIKQRAGRFFVESCPDFSAAALLAAADEHCLYVDAPLMLGGCGGESIGGSTLRRMNNATTNAFWAEYRNGHEIAWQAPLRQGSVPNAIADSLLRCQLLLGEPLAKYELDWPRYFQLCWQQIEQERRFGGETAGYVAEWKAALAAQSPEIQSSVRRQLRLEWLSQTITLSRRASQRLQRALGSGGPVKVIEGCTAGFSNIAECAKFLEREHLPASIPLTNPSAATSQFAAMTNA